MNKSKIGIKLLIAAPSSEAGYAQTKEIKMHTYFIYYTLISKQGQSGDGNIDVTVDSKIDSIEKIRELEKELIEKYEFKSLVITNFIHFGA